MSVLPTIKDNSVDCVITSPPYFQMRDYHHQKQLGSEKTWQEYVSQLVRVFHEIKRVLKNTGTFWLNIGDKYSGSHNGQNGGDRKWIGRNPENKLITDRKGTSISVKNLMGLPWRVALSLQDDGWILRQDIIWHKPNAMPMGGANPDRFTSSHEYLFLFTKIPKGYTWNLEAMLEPCERDNVGKQNYCTYWPPIGGKKYPGNIENNTYSGGIREAKPMRRMRDVWSIPTQPYSGAHFACFPEALVKRCILTGSPKGGVIMDCFSGSGTTGKVALENDRSFIGIELNSDYVALSEKRIGCSTIEKIEVK